MMAADRETAITLYYYIAFGNKTKIEKKIIIKKKRDVKLVSFSSQ
jgi:hypothetical protein